MSTADQTTTTPTAEPAPSASPLDRHAAPVADTRKRSGRAIAALILGIISVLGALIPIVGVIIGIVAIVLGATAASDVRRHNLLGRRQAVAGQVLGGIGVALSIVVWIIAAASMS